MINSHKKHCIYVIYLNATQRELIHVGFRRALTRADIQRERELTHAGNTELELPHIGVIFGSLRWE
jgi:hypothetical protein